MVLPAEFLDDLRARTPMSALVSRRVKLTRSGRQWKGCCPFHSEATPSFYVYDDGYHCFSCGAHGDAIVFVMKTENKSLMEPVKILAKEAGLLVPDDKSVTVDTPESVPLADAAAMAQKAPLVQSVTVTKNSEFPAPPESLVEEVMATAARILVRQKHVAAASIIANADGRLSHWEHDERGGNVRDTWQLLLEIPIDVYIDLDKKEDQEGKMNEAFLLAMQAVSDRDIIQVKIVTALYQDKDWRQKIHQDLSGANITNQGRVRSDKIAAREYDGLLFRSRPEACFYKALKEAGIPFAPLSVVLQGGKNYNRVEPDFIIYQEGVVMIVEIDGDLFHTETPVNAHARLKFMTDEGLYLERINASACDTVIKARAAVSVLKLTMAKIRKSR